MIRMCSFVFVALVIQQNVLAADCHVPPGELAHLAGGTAHGQYSHKRLTRTDASIFLKSYNENDLAALHHGSTVEEQAQQPNKSFLTFSKKMYDAYLKDHRQKIAQILDMNVIAKQDISKIQRIVAKAVRDVCASEGSSFTFSQTQAKTVKLPKQLALHNLKRLLDHLAFCRELDYGISEETRSALQDILEKASLALVSCESFPEDFEIADKNRYSSPTTPKLNLAKRNSKDEDEMPAMMKEFKETANRVKQITFTDDGVVAFSKSCLEASPYAEEENKRFGGINEKWIAAFSARHKHRLNFHVPAIIIDDEKQEFSATPEGNASLLQTRFKNPEVIKEIPIDSIQRYFVFVFLFNFSDSHLGNIRLGKNVFGKNYLISIDHGESLQVFYENPGTSSIRFGHLLELFLDQSLIPMHHRVRKFLMDLDPKAEVEFIRTVLNSDLKAVADKFNDGKTDHYFNRKLDHFRLNLEFLKAVATERDSTFADAFELRRGQFRINVYRKGERNNRRIRNFYLRESLQQRTVSILQHTKDLIELKDRLADDTFRQFDPSCAHLLNDEDKKQIGVFSIPEENKTAIDIRLDEEFFEAFARSIHYVLFPHIRNERYHRLTKAELDAYKDIGF